MTAPLPFDLNLAREAFATSAGLHAAATRRAADRLTAADYDALRAHDAAFTQALAEGRVEDAIEADDAFHRVFLDVADDPDLKVSVDLMLPRLRRMDLWLFTRKSFAPGQNTHPETIAALEAGDVDTAVALIEESYTHAGEALAAIVERRAGGDQLGFAADAEPPPPALEIVAPSASPEEAAAVVAALQQFLRDYAPVIVSAPPRANPWQRAALLEGTGREPDGPSPWGDPVPWGT